MKIWTMFVLCSTWTSVSCPRNVATSSLFAELGDINLNFQVPLTSTDLVYCRYNFGAFIDSSTM